MQVVYENCAGLDVHKKTVVACLITPKEKGGWEKEIRTFSTMTKDLLNLSDWLTSKGCTQVAMESTGEYWRPVYNILEGNLEVILVNARHIKAVPGRKTDIKDAQWIGELLQHGLLRPSFIPPVPQRDLRDLTRHRSNFVRERVNLVNRVQKVLESANIKLGCVASDVLGVSGRAMLEAIVAGNSSPEVMAALAQGTLRQKQDLLVEALSGRVRPHQQFILAQLLSLIDSIDETIAQFDREIEEYCRPFEQAVELVDTIPGVARRTAEVIVSEIGTDMSRFPSAEHLAAWAGLAPGNYESGGKTLSASTRKGNRVLRTILVQSAHALARTKTYLAAQYRRLSARRGKKRAAVAVAHSILVIAYHLISRQEPYRDLGADYFDQQRPESVKKRLVKRLEKLGYQVTLEPVPVVA
ncbi:MAG: IS110 family transposase [Microcystis aeruginosa TA09]|uniref:IS110 family transposase n=1 Tax=Microcystis aeruginosa TaxID=1126 RepID=UPI000E38F927|nr:IS110 family transposase [Microcystis aeruginosa]REJ45251.1 MAG: IS110 family transposase [Microcystis aeruginosa TA09]REJ58580.1 MAG: IS110 family transposase [Microcystis aeruginosa TA09]UZO75563.1 IS110 family transposase [Microcystis aeruginosa str. Chao 1910]UZO78470.1 IS110 family transposase [Microcystis aeruginosa str. Chao 1910]